MTRPTNITSGSVFSTATGTVGAPSVVITVGDIADVDLGGVTDGDTLHWDSGSGTWVVGPAPFGVIVLDDITDVVLTSPVAGERLRYDGSVWRNSSLKWKPVLALDPGSGLYVNVHSGGDPVMAEG